MFSVASQTSRILLNQLQDLAQVLSDKRFIRGAGVLNLNDSFATDEKAGGDAQQAVSFGHSTIFIQQNGKRQALFLSVSLHSFSLFADIYSQDDETLIAVLFVSLLQSGPLFTAVRSPGGPEIEEHRLASQVA